MFLKWMLKVTGSRCNISRGVMSVCCSQRSRGRILNTLQEISCIKDQSILQKKVRNKIINILFLRHQSHTLCFHRIPSRAPVWMTSGVLLPLLQSEGPPYQMRTSSASSCGRRPNEWTNNASPCLLLQTLHLGQAPTKQSTKGTVRSFV